MFPVCECAIVPIVRRLIHKRYACLCGNGFLISRSNH
nr:permease [Brevibacillus laterosporus]